MRTSAQSAPPALSSSLSQPPVLALSLTSAEVKEDVTIRDQQVLNAFSCTGDNLSPTLGWNGVSSSRGRARP